MDITRPAWLEINLKNLQYNIKQIQNKVGPNVNMMPVIKASGYGTYINQRLDVINQFDIVAVATVDEGVFIRKLGYDREIFIFPERIKRMRKKIILSAYEDKFVLVKIFVMSGFRKETVHK